LIKKENSMWIKYNDEELTEVYDEESKTNV
jgi:hypothetical protein